MALATSCVISRASLGIGSLQLQDPANGYGITRDMGPGGVTWAVNKTGNTFTHGEFIISAKREMMQGILGIRVTGDTHATLNSRADAVLKAFSQLTYTLTITIEGVVYSWNCWVANVMPDKQGTWDRHLREAKKTELLATIPRHPIPITGII